MQKTLLECLLNLLGNTDLKLAFIFLPEDVQVPDNTIFTYSPKTIRLYIHLIDYTSFHLGNYTGEFDKKLAYTRSEGVLMLDKRPTVEFCSDD